MSFWKSVLKDVIDIGIESIILERRGRKPGPIIGDKTKYGSWPYFPYEGAYQRRWEPA